MLSELLARFFRRSKPVPEPEPDRVAERVEGRFPSGRLPDGKVVYVFRHGALVDVCRDEPPKAMEPDDACWLVPRDDFRTEVTLELGQQTIAGDVAVRFEPDTQLADLLRQRTELTTEDLASLVTSELAGLLDLLGQHSAADLLELDDDSRERLRAKLSLLLQNKGLRCTAVENLRPAPVAEEPAEEPAPAEAAAEQPAAVEATVVEELIVPEVVEEVERELAGVVGQVQSDAQWDLFLGDLEEAGLETDETAAAELDEMGEKLVDGELRADQVAARIRQMADAAAQRAGVPQPDLRRWRGLALRLRTMEEPARQDEAAPAQPAPTGPPVRLQAGKRPWTWWMLRRRSVDDRLRRFLGETTRQSRAALQQYRGGLSEIRHAARIRELDQRLQIVEDLLGTVPTLAPRQRKLRPDRARVKELVRSVERAVTAAEMTQAAGRKILQCEPGSEAWEEAAADTQSAVDTLAEHLRARRTVR